MTVPYGSLKYGPPGSTPAAVTPAAPVDNEATDDPDPDVDPARNLSPDQFPGVIQAPGGSGYIKSDHPVAKKLSTHRNARGLAQLARGGSLSGAQHAAESHDLIHSGGNQFSGGI